MQSVFAETVVDIPIRSHPVGLAINPITNMIYVTHKAGIISIIDGNPLSVNINKVIFTIKVGDKPTDVAVNPTTNKVYVANYNSCTVSVIDVSSGSNHNHVMTIPMTDKPIRVAVNSITNQVYITNDKGIVSVLDGNPGPNENTVTLLPTTASHVISVAVDQTTNRIYLIQWQPSHNNSVLVLDDSYHTLATILVKNSPTSIAVNPTTNRVYVTNGSNTVSVIDGKPGSPTVNKVISKIQLTNPTDVAVNPTTNKVYVANYNSGTVSVIDGNLGPNENKVTPTINLNDNPIRVAVNPTTNRVYVTKEHIMGLSVIYPPQITITQISAAPNPFSPNVPSDGIKDTTWISFASNKDGMYLITVKNSAGVIVRTLTGIISAGINNVLWDGKDNSGSIVTSGQYDYFITASAELGNTRVPTASDGKIAVDTMSPNAPVILIPSTNIVRGNPSQTITGTSEAGSTVQLFDNGIPIGNPITSVGGIWFSTIIIPAGAQIITAQAIDPAGNTSTFSNPVTITVDTTGPIITNLFASPNPTNTNPTITATVTDTFSKISYAEFFIDSTGTSGSGTMMTASDGTFDSSNEAITGTIGITQLSNGAHIVYVHARDSSGNWGPFVSVTITVDTIPPILGVSTPSLDPGFGGVINLSNNGGISYDPQIAVSGKYTYVVWYDNSNGVGSDIFFRASKDGGITFGPTTFLTNAGGNLDVHIAVSGNNVYVVWNNAVVGNYDVFFRTSHDNGDSWNPPLSQPALNLSNNNGVSAASQIATYGNNVYIVWEDNSIIPIINSGGYPEIFYKRSIDNGDSFGSIINISNDHSSVSNPQIAASGNNVYVLWTSVVPGYYGIEYNRSIDGGASFETSTANLSSPNSSDMQQLATSGSNVYTSWRGCVNACAVYFRASNSGGDNNWTPALGDTPTILSSGTWPSDGYQKISASGNNVYVVWLQGSKIYLRTSVDGGKSFDSANNLSATGLSSKDPEISAINSNLYAVWSDVINTGNNDIFFRESTDNGATFDPIITTSATNISLDTGDSIIPQISASGNNVYVVWVDTTPGNYDVFFVMANGLKLNSDTLALSGTTSDISGVQKVEISIDGNVFSSVSGTTLWSFTTQLTTGTHTVIVKSTDKIGNVATTTLNVTAP